MAIIAVSRQFYSNGDEICRNLANQLGYRLIDHEVIRKKILELGFSEEKLNKFDGVRPSLFSRLSKNRDEYLYYLKTAVLAEAEKGDCVIVGRGAFLILREIESCISVRIIEERKSRAERFMKKNGVNYKTAFKQIKKGDWHQYGFHRTFFDFKFRDNFIYNFIVNSGKADTESLAASIREFSNKYVTEKRLQKSKEKINELLLGQKIVNMLVFVYGINIDSFRAEVSGTKITLYGVSSSRAEVRHAFELLNIEIPEFEIESKVHVVQDSR